MPYRLATVQYTYYNTDGKKKKLPCFGCSTTWAKYRAERAALEAIRSQIEEKSKIVLCVYSSREIAPFDEAVEINLDDTSHDELFNQLREQPEAEDFRPKNVRTVARLIRIVTNLGSPVEILFEDEEIKTAYEVFMKSA